VLRRCRRKSQGVLAAKVLRDGVENFGHFAIESWEESIAAGQTRKAAQLVLRLKIVDAGSAGRIKVYFFGHPDGENRHIGFLETVQRLVEIVLAEGIKAGCQDED